MSSNVIQLAPNIASIKIVSVKIFRKNLSLYKLIFFQKKIKWTKTKISLMHKSVPKVQKATNGQRRWLSNN